MSRRGMKLGSTWLENPTDEQMIEKAATGLGSIMLGAPLVQRLAKAAETPVHCQTNPLHVFKLADVVDRSTCALCKGVLYVKGAQPEDETEPVTVRTVKSEMTETGGTVNFGQGDEPLTTSKSRVRRPWTGTR